MVVSTRMAFSYASSSLAPRANDHAELCKMSSLPLQWLDYLMTAAPPQVPSPRCCYATPSPSLTLSPCNHKTLFYVTRGASLGVGGARVVGIGIDGTPGSPSVNNTDGVGEAGSRCLDPGRTWRSRRWHCMHGCQVRIGEMNQTACFDILEVEGTCAFSLDYAIGHRDSYDGKETRRRSKGI